jgi:hypothetical protein
MQLRSLAVLAASSGLAAAVSGQIITTSGVTANLSLSWMEDPAFPHNNDGSLDPGERALFLINLSFSGQNTSVSFTPPLGPFTSGTVLGLGSAYFDIRDTTGDASGLYNGGVTVPASSSTGPNSNNTGTSGYGVRGGWRLGGNVANGAPSSNGFANIGPGQLPTAPEIANTTNPINGVERLGWVPDNFAVRYEAFSIFPAAGTNNNVVGLYLSLNGGTTGGAAFIPTSSITFGSVVVPIGIPGPASAALLVAAGTAMARRRRAH